MAITSTYPIIVPKLTDLIVGTQTYTVEDPVLNNPTRNFTVQSIADLVSSPGTANTIAMFSTSGLTDSLITQAGSSITVAGNTGITGSLTINNTTTNAGIFMNSSSTGFGGNYIQAKKSDGSEQWLLGSNSGFDDRITLYQANSADIKIKIMSNEAVTIKPNGDVGINKTLPSEKLEVGGNIKASGVIIDSGTSIPANLTLKATASSYGGGGVIDIIGGADDFVSYKTYVKLSGGTTVASQVYDMNGDGWTWDGNMQTGVNTGTSYNFKSGGSSQMVIYNSNVGINVTSPRSKLQVNGGIQMADDTDIPLVAKVGTLRYRAASTGPGTYASYIDMCMQTGISPSTLSGST